MKAVGYQKSLPIDQSESLLDVDLSQPMAEPYDLLVHVKAVSVNPIDAKVRKCAEPPAGQYKVLGFDASGVVASVGEKVTLFKPGDDVFYAGSIERPGTNSEYHVVNEAIVGIKPKSLSFADAAALPLTSITAWELLFDRLQVPMGKDSQPTIVVVGGAGGVGSILIQLARQLTGATIIATASRPETREWCLKHGVHYVIDHSKPIDAEIAALNLGPVDFITCLTNTDQHWQAMCNIVKAQGRIGLIEDAKSIDINLLKCKSASLHWEFMFTRPVFSTPDIVQQHNLLNQVSKLIDARSLQTTVGEHFGTINAANLRRAHALLESGKAKGKIVLEGF